MSKKKKSIWDEVYEATKRQIFIEHLVQLNEESEKYRWREWNSSDYELGVSIYDYETEDEFEEALEEAQQERYGWRENYNIEAFVDPEDYETEEESLEALNEEKYGWRMDYDCEYDIDPDDYETEEEFLEDLKQAKYGWREEYKYIYDLDPEDYETEEEFLEALAEDDWQDYYESDKGVDPYDFETEDEFLLALDDAYEKEGIDRRGNKSLDSLCPKDYPSQGAYEVDYFLQELKLGYHSDLDENERKERLAICNMIRNNAFPEAKYLTLWCGFQYGKAISEEYPLPKDVDTKALETLDSPSEVLEFFSDYDGKLTFDVWKWCMDKFWRYNQYDRRLLTELLEDIGNWDEDFLQYLSDELMVNQSLRSVFLAEDWEAFYCGAHFIYELLRRNAGDQAVELLKSLENNPNVTAEEFMKAMNSLIIGYCTNDEEPEVFKLFYEKIWPLSVNWDQKQMSSYKKEWEMEIADHLANLENAET